MNKTAFILAASLFSAYGAGPAYPYEHVHPPSSAVYIPMVAVPGGAFVMGNTGAAEGESNERPTHEVEVAPFAIGAFEVTQAQFEAVMGYNPSFDPASERPVEQVSWYDAVRFCN
ncbi:MAG: SUMF1/EgtB/PvdO family nonheme iron enzyme, partial [Bacteroidota bacterium]